MGFWGIIGAGWRGAFGAIRQNKLLFIGVLAAQALVQGIAYLLAPLHYVQRLSPNMQLHMYIAGSHTYLFIRSIALELPDCIIVAPLMVAVHRFVLLHDTQNVWLNGRRLAFFAVILAVIHFSLIELPGYIGQLSSLAGLTIFISLWLIGRLVLTYPAIALDMPEPWKESWRRTSGHWWFIAGAAVVITLPIYLIILPEFFTYVYSATPATVMAGNAKEAIVATFTTPLWYAVMAALASELFRKFGGVPAQA